MINIFTIGCAGKSACEFFEALKQAGIKKVIDVRLYNTSQLAGYAKKQDLQYLLQKIVRAEYVHMPMLAPTKTILNDYKKSIIDWNRYEIEFNDLIDARQIENSITPEQADRACFLCSEAKPDHCHRRLIAEYLSKRWKNTNICHL